MGKFDKYKSDLEALIKLGESIETDVVLRNLKEQRNLKEKEVALAKELKGTFEKDYQRWYTEACTVIRQLIPDRIVEFQELYKGSGKRKTISLESYNIQDWLIGLRASEDPILRKSFSDLAAVAMRFRTQLAILQSVLGRFESTLFDLQQIIRADIFDSELDSARELTKHGFLRGAGAIAGVVLEKHLAQVAKDHSITVKKKDPAINDFNELLKTDGIIDIPVWR